MSYLLPALPGNLHWLFSPQQIHLNQCGTAQPENCEKMCEVHSEPQSGNLGRTGGATAPPSCQTDEIRTRKLLLRQHHLWSPHEKTIRAFARLICLHYAAVFLFRCTKKCFFLSVAVASVGSHIFFNISCFFKNSKNILLIKLWIFMRTSLNQSKSIWCFPCYCKRHFDWRHAYVFSLAFNYSVCV